MKRERWDLDFVLELFETSHACQLDGLRDRSIRPKRAVRNSEIKAVTHRPDTTNFLRSQVAQGTILLTGEMQTFRRNLVQVNFHAPTNFMLSARPLPILS